MFQTGVFGALALAFLNGHARIARRALEGSRIDAAFLHHVLKIRPNLVLIFNAVGIQTDRHNHAAAAVGVQVVLRVILHHTLCLRMNMRQVIGLVERIDARLPIGLPGTLDVMHHMHPVDFILFNVARRQTNVFAQRHRFTIHVDEDDAAQRIAAHFAHSRAMRNQLGIKAVLVRDLAQFAVYSVLPAVKAAGEFLCTAAFVHAHGVAAMRADIVEGANAAVGLAHDHETFCTNVKSDIVAFLGYIGGNAG